MTIGQLREDYESDFLVQRCLQVHGTEGYPSSFRKILGLQEALGGFKHEAVLLLLDHLKTTQFIDDIRGNDCLWIIEIVEENMIDSK